jgi:SAM-dependent methyltransferase
MERIPEPELMDDPAQARAYAGADFTEPHEAFVRYFGERFPGHQPRRVLDLGCGPADVTIRFARAWPQCTILGVDGAQAMLDLGREAVDKAGLANRIRLIRARLPDLPSPLTLSRKRERGSDSVASRRPDHLERFDTVISNSLLHHLHDPAVLWETVRAYAQSGAAVFVMDLVRPGSREDAARLVEEHARGEPEILRRDFYNSLLAAFRPEEVREQLDRAGLSGLRIETVSDRHMVIYGGV